MKPAFEKLRIARSQKDFPDLRLEDGEYVELVLRRSNYGYAAIWAGVALGSLTLLILALVLGASANHAVIMLAGYARAFFYIVFYLAFVILILFGVVTSLVYSRNILYVTNQRLIQLQSISFFHTSTNVIDLEKVEDVSFKQSGIIAKLFHYGTIRMATVGDETTYTFDFLDTPKDELEQISHLVHEKQKKQHEDS